MTNLVEFLDALNNLAELNDYNPEANPEYYRGGKELLLDMFADGDNRGDIDHHIDLYVNQGVRK